MKDGFTFNDDIDSILAEFSDFSGAGEEYPSGSSGKAADEPPYEPAYEEAAHDQRDDRTVKYTPSSASRRREHYTDFADSDDYDSYAVRRKDKDAFAEDYDDASTGSNAVDYADEEVYADEEGYDDDEDYDGYEDDDEDRDYDDDYDEAPRPRKKDSVGKRILFGFAGVVFAVISIAVIAWSALNIHPDAKTSSVIRNDSRANIFTQLDTFSNNAKSDILGDLVYIRKSYSIPESSLSAPVPDPSAFGEIPYSNPQAVLNLIQKAKDDGLIGENETVAFNPNAEFFADDRNIQYYYDETILMISWKELIENRICSFVEVKIADASQIRRKLANDTYQTAVQINCSDLAASANAVVAMNADFFAFRDYGITVYQRQVYRDNPRMVDTCYITSSGDLIYSRSGELATVEEAQAFVYANDVLFSLAFGPVLIDNGQVQYCPTYPMGEIDQEYSRAGIGQVDKLHYLYMTVNHTWPDREMHPRCSVNEFAQIFATKPVFTAYNLDGGQTSEINIRGQMFNRVDWGEERPVSDIIYFATALDNSEVTS